MTTIAVCIPNLGTITAACTRAVLMAQNACLVQERPYSFLHVDVETVIIGKARSMLTRVAMEAGADVLFMVDQDVVIPPHAIVALMDRNLPIVGGYYVARRPPYLPQIYTTEGADENALPGGPPARVTPRQVYWPITNYPEEPVLFEVDAMGAGCLMIRREVFEHMARLQKEEDVQLHEAIERLKRSADPIGAELTDSELELLLEHVRIMDPWWEFLCDEGEDMYFCRKARGAGYKIYCDLSVKCYHLGIVPIEEGHFQFIKPILERTPQEDKEASDEHPSDSVAGG